MTDHGFYNLFKYCTALTSAPKLPSTTLAPWCYAWMFQGCTSLVQAPELPAIELADYCYTHMFDGCTKLNYVKAMFTSAACALGTGYWLSNVSPTGTFIKNRKAKWDKDVANIPYEWTVKAE